MSVAPSAPPASACRSCVSPEGRAAWWEGGHRHIISGDSYNGTTIKDVAVKELTEEGGRTSQLWNKRQLSPRVIPDFFLFYFIFKVASLYVALDFLEVTVSTRLAVNRDSPGLC